MLFKARRVNALNIWLLVGVVFGVTFLQGCDDTSSTADTTETSSTSTSSSSSSFDLKDYADLTVGDCEDDSDLETLVCATDAFISTLTTDEQDELIYDWDDSTAKTTWSNLPTGNVQRNGLKLGDLSDESLEAAIVVARAALSDAGYEDFLGVLAADDYLNEQGGGSAYSSENYYLAFVGYPSVGGSWMLQLGGHHLAYNITYIGSDSYPVPNHIGTEPKASFEINSTSYAPLVDEGDALVSMFESLDSDELSDAYLSGENFSDVLMGPDNGSGELPTDYPEGSERGGVLVSSLTEAQQALVTAAIEQWVSDYPSDVATPLLEEYTSSASYADTYIAWAGDQSSGVDVDVSGTYMRIDGPRLWIEVACQSGVIITDQTHYHTMFRDKDMDYGDSL